MLDRHSDISPFRINDLRAVQNSVAQNPPSNPDVPRNVLPHEIRDRLWVFLEDRRPQGPIRRPHEETLADLMRSHASIRLNLEALKERAAASRGHT